MEKFIALRKKGAVSSVYILLSLIVLACLGVYAAEGEMEKVLLCLLALGLFLLPGFIAAKLRVLFPAPLHISLLLFVFASEILGEIGDYYSRFPPWDSLLHITWGFICASFGYCLGEIFGGGKMPKGILIIFALCFSTTTGVLWEFFEFFADSVFGLDMQKDSVINSIRSLMLSGGGKAPAPLENIRSVVVNGQELGLGGYLDIGLRDTMGDLLVNFLGAAGFALIAFFDGRRGGKNSILRHLVPRRHRQGQ